MSSGFEAIFTKILVTMDCGDSHVQLAAARHLAPVLKLEIFEFFFSLEGFATGQKSEIMLSSCDLRVMIGSASKAGGEAQNDLRAERYKAMYSIQGSSLFVKTPQLSFIQCKYVQ